MSVVQEALEIPEGEQVPENEAVLQETWAPRDLYDVRKAMLAIAKHEKAKADRKTLLARIIDDYKCADEADDQQIAFLRGAIEGYIVNVNGGQKVSIPDAGTAYLSKRAAKVEVADEDKAKTFVGYATKEVPDWTATKKAALAQVVAGEEIPEGFAFIPESKTLVIKEAK